MMLNGKTAIVTGAAGAAGLAAVRVLIEDGAQVALVDSDALRLDSLIRFLRGTTVAVPCDGSDPGAVRQAFAQIEKQIRHTLDNGLIQLSQNFGRFLNILGDVGHQLSFHDFQL